IGALAGRVQPGGHCIDGWRNHRGWAWRRRFRRGRLADHEAIEQPMTRISTIVPTYNQEGYIDAAIGSVVEQLGEFSHEILVSSDGSTDGTRAKIQEWRKRYPMLVRDISEESNVGISGNFRRLFEAAS